MAKRRIGECVYCGKVRRLTDDHVPPKSLCQKPWPSDLIKVPSCSFCNNGASLDDEYFKTVMVLKDKAGSHSEAAGIRASVLRALQMPEKRGFFRAVAGKVRRVQIRTSGGLYLGRRTAFDVKLDRLDSVVSRITRGLFWHHQGTRIPDGFEVAVFSEDGLRKMSASDIEAIKAEVVIPVRSNPSHSLGRGVMLYWYALTDRAPASVWLYEFYEDVRFAAFVIPAEGNR